MRTPSSPACWDLPGQNTVLILGWEHTQTVRTGQYCKYDIFTGNQFQWDDGSSWDYDNWAPGKGGGGVLEVH